jgi:putative methionine-R-sulfoxide reductase with GAF domain
MKFENAGSKKILYRTQWVFFVVSIIPLAVLTFVCRQYVFPILESERAALLITSIYVTLGLTLALSILGYVLTRRNTIATIETIECAQARLTRLLEVGNRMSHTTEMDDALREATQAAVKIIGADMGLSFLMEGNRLVCRYAEGLPSARADRLTFALGEGIVGTAAGLRKLLCARNSGPGPGGADPLNPTADYLPGPAMCCPLVYQDRVIGAIEVIRSETKEPFTESDQYLVEILGRQAAATFLNAEYHESQQNYFAHMIELLRFSLEEVVVWEGHLHNVARYSNLITRKLDLDEDARRDIHFAAMLHDIGFLKLRSIVGRPELKDFQEKIREHPRLGSQLIEPIKVWKNVAPLILCHHEHVNGSGYPQGLKYEEIPLGSRIIAVAEVFDTMVNPNSYVPSLSRREALADLETGAGVKYDTRVVQAFMQVLREEEETKLASCSIREPVTSIQ